MRCRFRVLFVLLFCVFLIASVGCVPSAGETVADLDISHQSSSVIDAEPIIDAGRGLSAGTPPTGYTPLPLPEPTPEPTTFNARLAVVGDLMAHESQINHAHNRATNSYSFTSCFEDIKPYLEDADYTIGNLETTLSGEAARYTGYPVFNTPDAYAEAIKWAGFDMLTTANNHSNDRGEAGIVRTLEVLDSLGIDHVGTYATEEDQARTFIKEINGIRFAFLSYTYSTNGIPLTRGKPFLVNMLDEDLMRRQIEQARQDVAEVIVVLPHMGNEYEETPAHRCVTLARKLCEYGADVIMASHPHVLQPTEFIEVQDSDGKTRTCFITYSMGNFLSGQRTKPRDVGAVFYLDFEKIVDEDGNHVRLTHASFAPTWVQFYDSGWNTRIRILPVFDVLTDINAGHDLGLLASDVNRLREVHRETTRKMLGAEVPTSEMKAIYTLYWGRRVES